MVDQPKIGVVLPYRESFGILKSGAVALCARDFASWSRFRDSITIIGAGPCEYSDVRYRRIEDWRRWWMRGRKAYARAVAHVALVGGRTQGLTGRAERGEGRVTAGALIRVAIRGQRPDQVVEARFAGRAHWSTLSIW